MHIQTYTEECTHTHIYIHTQKNTISRAVLNLKDIWPTTSSDDPEKSHMPPSSEKIGQVIGK